MEQVSIRYQDRAGNWTTVMMVQNLAPNIAIALRSTARSHPARRVRAVDAAGRVVDML